MFNETEFNEIEFAAEGPDGLSDTPYYVDVFETIGGLSPSIELAVAITMSESIDIVDDLVSVIGATIREEILIGAELTDKVTTKATFSEILKLKDQSSYAMAINFDVLFSVDDSLDLTRQTVIEFLESLVISGSVDSIQRAILSLSEALAISAEIKLGGYYMNLAESLGIDADITMNYRAIINALETIVIGDTQEMTARVTAFFDEDIEFSQEIDSRARMAIALHEGIEFGGVFNLPEGVFEAWVVNVETKAPWQYDNYPFNSFAKAEGEYLALSSSGLYELSGDTDDGDIINAIIRTGLENFGSSNMKSIPVAYFGYTSGGRVLFKTITTESGDKIERWYELKEKTANDTTEGKVKMGRGVRAVYWQFEIENIDGSDFDFDSVKLLPAILKRRI